MPTAEEMMPSPADTRPQISVLVADLRRIASLVATGTQVGTWDGTGTPGWVGEAADAHMASISKLRSKLSPLVNGVQNAADEAARWAEALGAVLDNRIPELHEEWNHVQRVVEEEQRKAAEVPCSPDGHPVPSAPSRTGEMDPWAHARRQELLEDYKKVIDELNVAAQDAAKAVKVARSLFLPDEVGTSRNEIGLHMFEDEDSILEAQNRWERGEEIAKEIEQRFDQGFDNSTELQEFLDEYGDDLEDPFVATALGRSVSPAELTELVLDVNIRLDDDLCVEFMESVGAAMILASGGVNMSPQHRESQELLLGFDEALSDMWSDGVSAQKAYSGQMVVAGQQEYPLKWGVHQGKPLSGTVIMSQIMGQAGSRNPGLALGEDFFEAESGGSTFMDELLRVDASWSEDGRYMNAIRRRVINHGLVESLGDPVYAMTTVMDRPVGLGETSSEVLDDWDLRRRWGVKKVFAADVDLAGESVADKDYNHDGVIDERDRVANVVQYIMGRRTIGYPAEYSGFPDGGELFGDLVLEASFPESAEGRESMSLEELEAWEQREEQGARIASGFLQGYQEGLENYESVTTKVDGQRDFGVENPALRRYAGDILGPRLRGIAKSFEGGNSSVMVTDGDPDGRYLISFDSQMASRLIGPNGVFVDLAFDGPATLDGDLKAASASGVPSQGEGKSAVDKLIMWSHIGYDRDLQEAIPGRLGDGSDAGVRVPAVSKRWAYMFEALFTAPEGASLQAQDAVRQRNSWWQRAVHVGADLGAGGLGLVVGPGAGLVVDQATQHVAHPVIDLALPDDFELSGGHARKDDLVRDYMSGILMHRAFEDVDYSAVRPTPEEHAKYRPQFRDHVLAPDGGLKPLSSLGEVGRVAYLEYLTDGLVELNLVEAFNNMDIASLKTEERSDWINRIRLGKGG